MCSPRIIRTNPVLMFAFMDFDAAFTLNVSLDNHEQVDKVVHQRSAGDPCFAPRGRAGTCVLVVNSIGWFVSVFALIAVAWAPSSLNDEEEGGKDTSFGWAWTRESMSLQADLVRGFLHKRCFALAFRS